jgi:hypothetical protein
MRPTNPKASPQSVFKAPTQGQPKPSGPAPFNNPRVRSGDSAVTPAPIGTPKPLTPGGKGPK